MSSCRPPVDDMATLLVHVLGAPARLRVLDCHAQTDAELLRQVLEEAGKSVAGQVAPLRRDGDEIGCMWNTGRVSTPPGFRQANQAQADRHGHGFGHAGMTRLP